MGVRSAGSLEHEGVMGEINFWSEYVGQNVVGMVERG